MKHVGSNYDENNRGPVRRKGHAGCFTSVTIKQVAKNVFN